MKKLQLIIPTIILLFTFQSVAMAQSTDITETFKKHFNETVQQVHVTEDADEKRSILNNSYNKMLTALKRIESKANLNGEEVIQLQSFKNEIKEMQDELNGHNGFTEIQDEMLIDFSEYSQQYFEQANRTITISVTTALLIIIILLLLS